MKFKQNFQSLDLQGIWHFIYSLNKFDVKTIDDIHKSGIKQYEAVVPGNFELDLYQNKIIPDPYFGSNIKILRNFESMHICYFRTFQYDILTEDEPHLVFEGLDCIADVYINGIKTGSFDNMFIQHETSLSGILQEGVNEIVVNILPVVREALKYEYPAMISGFQANYQSLYIRKPAHMFGWDILPRIISAGIFRPVYIEFRPAVRFLEVYLQTSDITANSADSMFFYKCNFSKNPGDVWSIKLSGSCGNSHFTQEFILAFQYGKHLFKINNPLLWNAKGHGKANMYGVTAVLMKNGSPCATVFFNHGIRTVKLLRSGIKESGKKGEFIFLVNGQKVFAKGTNWVAADAFHSRDRDRIPQMLELAVDLNCNIIRCWGGNLYEDDVFYEICDNEGILIWQDFAMACAVYPQDRIFQQRLRYEAVSVIKRLRQHPCLALWAGDNECDQAYSWFGFDIDPNTNILTRGVLPESVRQHDPFRDYLPSSPYIDLNSHGLGEQYLPENHLWGIRDYFKSEYYARSTCRFASEMGYHGCPSPESIKKFISQNNLWPYGNEEWLLHSTSPLPEIDERYNFRVQLMANQIKVLFGDIPDNIEKFSIASQISQAEAKKFFIELFRGGKWERTGIIWWNLMDGWPQFSDAVVDYYFERKLAYEYIKRSQRDVILMFREPVDGKLELVVCNDLNKDTPVDFKVFDAYSDAILLKGKKVSKKDSVTTIGVIEYDFSGQNLYIIKWTDITGSGVNHYLAGSPPFNYTWYKDCMNKLIL